MSVYVLLKFALLTNISSPKILIETIQTVDITLCVSFSLQMIRIYTYSNSSLLHSDSLSLFHNLTGIETSTLIMEHMKWTSADIDWMPNGMQTVNVRFQAHWIPIPFQPNANLKKVKWRRWEKNYLHQINIHTKLNQHHNWLFCTGHNSYQFMRRKSHFILSDGWAEIFIAWSHSQINLCCEIECI